MPTTNLRRSQALIITKLHSSAIEHTLIGNLIFTDGIIIMRHTVSFKGNQKVSSAAGRKKQVLDRPL
ncbi:MAG: hypothetical protein GY774_26255 [Planctomycetes bacterium]|nr:hypothetical protein [Planctomycetota bacterium]